MIGGGLDSFRFSPRTGAGRIHRSKLAFDLSQNGVFIRLWIPRTGAVGGWHTHCTLLVSLLHLMKAPVTPMATGREIFLQVSHAMFPLRRSGAVPDSWRVRAETA